MYTDDVIEELWRAKDAHGAKYGWDIHAMAEALRRQQREEGRKVVSLAPNLPSSRSSNQQTS